MHRLQSLAIQGLIGGALDQSAVLRRVAGTWRSAVWMSRMERYSTAEATAASTALRKTKPREKTLSIENLNPQVKAVEYAVRGPIVIKAAQIERVIQQVRRAGTLPVGLRSHSHPPFIMTRCAGWHGCVGDCCIRKPLHAMCITLPR